MENTYEIAKDIIELKNTVQRQQIMIEQLYNVIEYNLKKGNLDEIKVPKVKE